MTGDSDGHQRPDFTEVFQTTDDTPGESLTVVTISEPSIEETLKTMCRFHIFQLAGFRHVLGSLSKDDGASHAYVAKSFYQSLKQNGSGQTTDWMVAKALHDAIKSARDLAKDPHW
ncbi:hypothetical protein HYE67_000072 [Fusarium culmorum]|uniref:Uncharacterized protein n=1 Tax=Fusarium culmorum TaxID=5516 RepID=A0A2T4GCF6_FUSCU|nr:hypothetical protein FCULG_00012693 [Fusarium culmorum]QPC57841.1 hypothetical protein HYE67_000072 [Fusarium culmorum]